MKNIISFFYAFNDDFFISKKGKKSILGKIIAIIALCLLFSVNLKAYLQLYNNIAGGIILCMFMSILELLFLIVSCLSFLMLISAISYCIKDNIKNLFFVIEYLILFCGSIRILVCFLFKI